MSFCLNKIKFLSIILCLVIVCSCGKQDLSKLTLATSDCGFVTAADFMKEYNTYSSAEKRELTSYNDYYKIVRKIALKKIIYKHALEQKIDQEPEIQHKLLEIQRTIGFDIIRTDNVVNKVMVVEGDFNKYKKTYTLYQIVRRTDTLDEKRIANSRQLMKNLATTIKTFDEFKNAATQYSEDVTKSKQGYMGEIRRGLLEDELDSCLAKLNAGQMSPVIETSTGLHLLFVEKVNNKDISELIRDKSIYDEIFNQKRDEIEANWYKKLLANNKLVYYKEKLNSASEDDTVIVSFKDQTITKKQIDDTVYKLRQNGAFPAPTKDELNRLVENMALNLVINNISVNPEVINRKEFVEKYEQQKSALLESTYISRYIGMIEPEESEIKQFYLENKVKLFTFKDGNREVNQSIDEAREFIISKLQEQSEKKQKYALYRVEIDKAHFHENENNIKKVMTMIDDKK